MKFTINPDDRLGVDSDEPEKPKKKTKPPPPPKPPRQKKKNGFWLWFFKWSCILLIWLSFFSGCFVLFYSYDLPDLNKLQQTERRPSVTILAKDGTKLATYGDLHGQMVDIKKLPPHVVQAFLAIEDRRFYSHLGVDPIGLLRAFWTNYRVGHLAQGGSTITQQLAKNFLQAEKLYDVNDRTLRRKAQEALLALWLEQKFTKDQILTMYINRVYLGSGTFGLGAAAQHYFGKRPQDLSVYEAAVIAGLLKAPTRYSPSNNPDLADKRATLVLENMVKEGFISEDLKDAELIMASTTPGTFKGSAIRYFTDYIVDILPTIVDASDKDVIVTTTLDPRLQSLAEAKVQETFDEKQEKSKVDQLALISMSYDGAIRALVGGTNYKKSQYNRATQALRQTGSAFKLVLYLAALESGMHPSDHVSDMPIHLGKWSPRNYKYQSRGQISLQDAMAHSVNTVSVRLAHHLGLQKVVETARRLGIRSALPDDLTIVLGTGESTLLELTAAYAIIARNGLSVRPYGIIQVTDQEGHLLYRHHEHASERVVHPQVAYELTQMMQAVMNYGTGSRSSIGRPSAGKTGTTQLDRDAWLVAFTPDLITGTWAGNDDNTSMDPKGGSPAARLWHLYMREASQEGSFASTVSNVSHQAPQPRQNPGISQTSEREEAGILGDFIDSLFGG